jgi:hypothetical protein
MTEARPQRFDGRHAAIRRRSHPRDRSQSNAGVFCEVVDLEWLARRLLSPEIAVLESDERNRNEESTRQTIGRML